MASCARSDKDGMGRIGKPAERIGALLGSDEIQNVHRARFAEKVR